MWLKNKIKFKSVFLKQDLANKFNKATTNTQTVLNVPGTLNNECYGNDINQTSKYRTSLRVVLFTY